ncbi:MAG: Glu/Leu/Phe/Val dehydrogenase dimerization domain-containing protein [Gemmatimonadota bacterium]
MQSGTNDPLSGASLADAHPFGLAEKLDRWGGEELILRRDGPTGAWIVIALHSSVMGPPTGGTRFKPYPDLDAAIADALRLSEGMTHKYAVAGFPRGGGKAVIHAPIPLDPAARAGLLRRYGSVLSRLGGTFQTGPDVGTSSEDMDVIGENGAPWVFARTPAAGGAGSSGPYTALGVFAGIRAACTHVFGGEGLRGRTVLVQGAGSVGERLITLLRSAGASVCFSDVDPECARRIREQEAVPLVEPEAVYGTACDVFAPCALGAVLNERTIPLLSCRLVAGGANNQLAGEADGTRLHERGILYVPDYAVNIGGAMAITGIEAMGWTPSEAERRVVESVERAVGRLLELVEREGVLPEVAARSLARERLAAASA